MRTGVGPAQDVDSAIAERRFKGSRFKVQGKLELVQAVQTVQSLRSVQAVGKNPVPIGPGVPVFRYVKDVIVFVNVIRLLKTATDFHALEGNLDLNENTLMAAAGVVNYLPL